MVTEVLDKIASIKPYLFPGDIIEHTWWSHKAYIALRIETKEGFVGWGECHNLSYRKEVIMKTIQSIAQALKGKLARDIRVLINAAFNEFGQQRPGVETYCAFAGIELALWDILGKRLGVPIYELLEGKLH